MKNKIGTILNTGKKKIAAAVMCGVLTLTLGTGVVFAANTNEKMLSRVENGVRSFSTDEGQTWSDNASEGFKETINEDGSSNTIVGNPLKDGEGMMVQNKNGVMSYSTDGGKTWSDKAPEGFEVSNNADGSVSVQHK